MKKIFKILRNYSNESKFIIIFFSIINILTFVFIILLFLEIKNSNQASLLQQYTIDKTKVNKYHDLKKIAIGTQISYLKQYLGEPAIKNSLDEQKRTEFIFVDTDYYVYLETDNNDSVLYYAITTRKKDFNPDLSVDGHNIQLGKTTFYDEGKIPAKCISFIGNTTPSFYYEQFDGWNGTSYHDYIYGYNDAGFGVGEIVFTHSNFQKEFSGSKDSGACILLPEKIRNQTRFNTVGVGKSTRESLGVNRRHVEQID